MKRILVLILGAGMLFWIAGCKKSEQASNQTPATKTPAQEQAPVGTIPEVKGDTVKTTTGLMYIEIKEGSGVTPKVGQTCSMYYTGWLTNGFKFDSSRDRNQPFPFPLGMGKVINGWEQGVGTMKVGGQRRLIIPPQLAWGDRGFGKLIPPGATVIFDVELLGVQ